MRLWVKTIALIALLSSSLDLSAQTEIQVTSFNIRYGTPGDGENKWKSRRDRVMTMFKRHKDGIIATQEALPLQIKQILKSVPQLDVVFRSRTLEDEKGEANAIFYNKKIWKVIDHETFWLSDTPDQPASKSWGNTLPRISTVAIMEHKESKKRIRLLNAHLDHRSHNSRVRSVELILRTLMTEVEPMPTILLGDFNVQMEDDIIVRIKRFFEDTYSGDELEGCTYHKYNGGSHCPRIDYIFFQKRSTLSLKSLTIDRWNSKRLYPSDHYPLVAKFDLN